MTIFPLWGGWPVIVDVICCGTCCSGNLVLWATISDSAVHQTEMNKTIKLSVSSSFKIWANSSRNLLRSRPAQPTISLLTAIWAEMGARKYEPRELEWMLRCIPFTVLPPTSRTKTILFCLLWPSGSLNYKKLYVPIVNVGSLHIISRHTINVEMQ